MTEHKKPEADEDLTAPRKCISSFAPLADAKGADHSQPPKGLQGEKEPKKAIEGNNER